MVEKENTLSDLLYTKPRAATILKKMGVPFSTIGKVSYRFDEETYYDEILIEFRYQQQSQVKFVHPGEFIALFYAVRKKRSSEYEARKCERNPKEWQVSCITQQKETRIIKCYQNTIICPCPDFIKQESLFREHPFLWDKVVQHYIACKHTFAVLCALGFTSYNSYLKNSQKYTDERRYRVK